MGFIKKMIIIKGIIPRLLSCTDQILASLMYEFREQSRLATRQSAISKNRDAINISLLSWIGRRAGGDALDKRSGQAKKALPPVQDRGTVGRLTGPQVDPSSDEFRKREAASLTARYRELQ